MAPIPGACAPIVNAALKDPAISGKLLPQGIVPKEMSPKDYKAFVQSETAKFGKIVEQAHITLGK
jgi:tripartite-type tricarboxylate transporter receptor subunit TctC